MSIRHIASASPRGYIVSSVWRVMICASSTVIIVPTDCYASKDNTIFLLTARSQAHFLASVSSLRACNKMQQPPLTNAETFVKKRKNSAKNTLIGKAVRLFGEILLVLPGEFAPIGT